MEVYITLTKRYIYLLYRSLLKLNLNRTGFQHAASGLTGRHSKQLNNRSVE